METMMRNRNIKRNARKILLLWIFVFFLESTRFAGAAGAPLIRIDQTIYTFPRAFEGEKLSHTFAVFNRGTGVLHIKEVRPS
jgi:hypothetical protein